MIDFFKSKKNNADTESQYDEAYYGKNEDESGADDYAYAATPRQEQDYDRGTQRRANYGPADTGASYSMKLMKPTLYSDGPIIANELINNNAVIINLENASAEVASNLIFFLDGVTYAINGHLKAVSATTFMLTPRTMEISETETGTSVEDDAAGSAAAAYGYAGYGSDVKN